MTNTIQLYLAMCIINTNVYFSRTNESPTIAGGVWLVLAVITLIVYSFVSFQNHD